MLNRIYIEISNVCNVQCSFCPTVGRDNEIMSDEDFEKILKQAAPLAEQVCLHLMGEPLAHPRFKHLLAICENYNVLVQLTTNGLLIKRYHDLLIDSPIIRQVNFSLQSFTDNFPEKSIDDYLYKILEFIRLGHEKRPELYTNLRLWNLAAQTNTDGVSDKNENIYRYIEQYFNIDIKRKVDVGGFKSKRLWNRLYLHFDTRFEWPSMDLPIHGDKGRCNGLVGHVGIQADGTVVPCCLDKEAVLNLGNCLERPLVDILNDERATKMRDGFNSGKLVESLCQRCSFIQRFSK